MDRILPGAAAPLNLHQSWLTIWYDPRQTIRRIVDSKPEYAIHWIAALWVLVRLRGSFGTLQIGDYSDTLILKVFWAVVLGRMALYLFSGCLVGVSKALGGQANPYAVLGAAGWAMVPGVLTGLVELLLETQAPGLYLPGLGLGLAGLTLAWLTLAWQGLILVLGLMEIHGFSAARAVSAVALTSLLVVLIGGGFWWFAAHPGGWQIDLSLG